MRDWVRFWAVGQWIMLGGLLAAPLYAGLSESALVRSAVPAQTMRAFTSIEELKEILARRVQLLAVPADAQEASAEGALADGAAVPAGDVDSSTAEPPPAGDGNAITNTQTAGVDEGGIVKKQGDLLIVLRRGRLFTIDTSGGGMRKVAAINAFPGTQDASDAWYDEMLVSDDQVIVVGYSYARQGTEVNRFRLSPDGGLRWRDTHYLRSGDYYSSRNYASRLIGNKLIFYAPLEFYNGIEDALPALAAWRGNNRTSNFKPFAEASDIYMPEPIWDDPSRVGDVLHSVMICDVGEEAMDCDSTNVIGGWSRSFYVSQNAVYIWTQFDSPVRHSNNGAMLYRIPLDGRAPSAAQTAGMPLDQFSFREEGDGTLNVLTMAEGPGDAMWGAEAVESGDMALLTLTLDRFGDGGAVVTSADYRRLPEVAGYEKQNRFVGNWLLYASGQEYHDLRRPGESKPSLYAVPLKGGEVVALSTDHGITRIDIMGRDAIAVGEGDRGALIFSTVALDGPARISNRFAFPDAGEGESRSHAFFYRPDRGGNGDDGLLGLPIWRGRGDGDRFLGNAASILFLRRDDRTLAQAGLLDARNGNDSKDHCLASCVDWYGNARPIFFGDRLFALMGYELVEGQVSGGRVNEKARLDFTPGPQSR